LGVTAAATEKLGSTRTQWVLIALLMVSAVINYVDRGSLSVAAPSLANELALSPVQMGVLLSVFFWAYAPFQLAAGWLTDRFPVYWVFAAGFFLWSLATFGCGLAHGLTALMAMRLLLGAGESVAFPSYSKVIAAGFPLERRGLPNSLLEAGTKLGPAIGTLTGGLVVAHYGWRALFLVMGGISMLWLAPWAAFAPRTAAPPPAERKQSATMLEILGRRDAWGTFIGNACYTYAYYFLLTWLPSYLVKERHVSLAMMGVLGSVPFWGAAAAAVAAGWTSDWLIKRGASPTRVRKSFVAGGLLLSTIMVPSVLVNSLTASIVLLSVGYVAFGIFASNHWAITQTLAGPAAAGKWTGIQNTIGNLSGIVAPVVTGFIVERTGQFFWAFLSPAILAVVGAWAYVFLVGPVAPIEWRRKG
jgi:MFS family permease